MIDPQLTARQRAQLPIDRWGARRGLSTGGAAPPMRPMTIAPGLVDKSVRDPGTTNDDLVVRDRGSWYHRSYAIPAGVSMISWTDAGPDRPILHVAQQTLATQVGTSASRYPYLPESPTGGMHTMAPHAVVRTSARYRTTQQMMPPRQDRLASGQYRGQSYSATTQTLR